MSRKNLLQVTLQFYPFDQGLSKKGFDPKISVFDLITSRSWLSLNSYLLQDSYLVGKMDKDHFVDVSVIAEFKLIKQLTTDVDQIIASVKGSDQVS